MINRGDDSDAFDFGFLEVDLVDADQYEISKAEVRIGNILKTYMSPVYPLQIKLNQQESMILIEDSNACRMAVYDKKGRKHTCSGGLVFPAEPKVV